MIYIKRKIRKIVQRIPNKFINWSVVLFGFLVLFSFLDIGTIKKIEIWGISDVANTAESFFSSFFWVFKCTAIRIISCTAFGLFILLRVIKFIIRPRAIVLRHSSFSNTQSTYDSSVVSGCSVKEIEINLIDQMANSEIEEAIRVQDELIAKAIDDCDSFTDLFYYGIAHIPLIFRAGFQVGDEGNVRLLHKYRSEQHCFREISSNPDNSVLQLQGVPNYKKASAKEMLVVVATSLPVNCDELRVFRRSNICCELRFELNSDSLYGFDSIDSYATMNRLRAGILNGIRKEVKKNSIKRIHLVLATSSDFAFFLAQGFSRNHDPEIVVYHYDQNSPEKYPWGISNIMPPANAVIHQTINSKDK